MGQGSGGEFEERIVELLLRTGADNFQWNAVPVCAHLEDFVWADEVVETSATPEERDGMLAQMVEKMAEMCH